MSTSKDSLNEKLVKVRETLQSAKHTNAADKEDATKKRSIIDEIEADLVSVEDKITAYQEGDNANEINRLILAAKTKLMMTGYISIPSTVKKAPIAATNQNTKQVPLCSAVIEFCRFFQPLGDETLGTESISLISSAVNKPTAFKLNLREDD